jgi:hypothetical protein
MKQVTFRGYVEDCSCAYCKKIRAIIDGEKRLHINSFKIEDENEAMFPLSCVEKTEGST